MTETTAKKQRGRPFPKGQSGNPAGQPKGTRHKTTLAMEALLDGEGEAITRKAVEMALSGDATALRLALSAFFPRAGIGPCRSRCRSWKRLPMR